MEFLIAVIVGFLLVSLFTKKDPTNITRAEQLIRNADIDPIKEVNDTVIVDKFEWQKISDAKKLLS